MSPEAQFVTAVQYLLVLGGVVAAILQIIQWRATHAAGGSNTHVAQWTLPAEKFFIILLTGPLCYIVLPPLLHALNPHKIPQDLIIFPLLCTVQTITLIILLATARTLSPGFTLQTHASGQSRPPPQWNIPCSFLAMTALIGMTALLVEGLDLLAQQLGIPLDLETKQETVYRIARARDDGDWQFLTFAALSMVIMAPVAEEIFFRGMMFPFLKGFLKRHLPANAPALTATLPALLTGTTFGLVHCNAAAFLPLAALGTYLCVVYEKTADIRVPIALHALQNLTILLTMLIAPEIV
jgi:membrane protease YdiL (CAAX protease family)